MGTVSQDYKTLLKTDTWHNALWVKDNKLCALRNPIELIQYLFHRNSHRAAVMERLNQLVEDISHQPNHVLDTEKENIRKLFFKKIAHLDYNRGLVREYTHLEWILAPRLCNLRANPLSEHMDPITGKNFALDVAEAKFSTKLGVKAQLFSGGSSGVYKIFNRDKSRILGAFKPSTEGPYGRENPRPVGHIKRRLPILNGRNCLNRGHIHLSEAATSRLDYVLGLDVVPKTSLVTFRNSGFVGNSKKKFGSFQSFVKGTEMQEYYKFNNELDLKSRDAIRWLLKNERAYNQEVMRLPQEEFEKLALLDMLIANIDRSWENWLIDERGKVIAMDNASSFTRKHPTEKDGHLESYLSTKHQYLWETLPHAEKTFSPHMTQLIQRLDFETLKRHLKPLLIDPKRPGTRRAYKHKMRCLNDRIRVLRGMSFEQKSIREMAQCRTAEDFERYL